MSKVTLSIQSSTDYNVAESFKTLRANIQFCGPKYKVIMFTSCMPNDGKSTISFEVANSFAMDGKKVLLLDCDLRKSVLQRRVTNSYDMPGTTEILSGQRNLRDCICNTQYQNLDIMFSGAMAPNPAELLNSDQFAILVEDARELYDLVIIDSPPLGAVIDAAVIAKQCDGAILIISANTISRSFAHGVVEQLRRSECPVMGVVLNRVEIHSGKYGSYYKYGKYYTKYYRYGSGYGGVNYGYGNEYTNAGRPQKKKKAKQKLSREQRMIQQTYQQNMNGGGQYNPYAQQPRNQQPPQQPQQRQRIFYDQDQDN
ncbi:MAG: CpsD/CapB family tyrosine-protein kinase [Clostridia bacterium]|nr:CpsD/CapB family tyrosine-protein kinase [Clostridia bacterium]